MASMSESFAQSAHDGKSAPTHFYSRIRFWFGLATVIALLAVAAVPTLLLLPAGSKPAPGAPPSVAITIPVSPTVAAPVAGLLAEQARRDQNAISQVLSIRANAVTAKQTDAFLQTTEQSSVDFTTKQLRLITNLNQLPLEQWDYELDGKLDGTSSLARQVRRTFGSNAQTYQVKVRYALTGFGDKPTVALRTMSFIPQGQTWKVVSDIDSGRFRQPWDENYLSVVQGPDVLMMVMGSAKPTPSLMQQASQAVAAVTTFWGSDWQRKVEIVIPASQRELGNLLRRNGADYSSLAALATAEGNGGPDDVPTNVVWVNPSGFAKINSLGRTIVLRHEILHVATGAAIPNDFPLWLEEGTAEYFGYKDSGVKQDVIAANLLQATRSGQVPTRLPTTKDFSPLNGQLDQAYEGSWWAVRYIVQTYSEQALLRVYRNALGQADPATAADRALREELGIDTAQLTAAWRASIKAAA